MCLPQSPGLWRWQISENPWWVLLRTLQSQIRLGTCLAIDGEPRSTFTDRGQSLGQHRLIDFEGIECKPGCTRTLRSRSLEVAPLLPPTGESA